MLSALEQEPRTVLLVTHDVDEALLLTHRVLVMSARPGRIVRTLETDLPRDRPRREVVTSPQFSALKESASRRWSDERPCVRPQGEAEREPSSSIVDRYGPPALVVVFTIAIWEIVIQVLDVPTYIWAPPSLIAQTIQENFSELLHHGDVTLMETMVGFFFAIVLGLAFGLLIHFSTMVRRAPVSPADRLAEHPDRRAGAGFVLVLGFGLWPKVAVVTLFCFFPIVVGTIDGLSGVDPNTSG